jgi:L-iditol 2-dehydrogenase
LLLLVEALSIAVHAVERTPISLNDTAVVVGSGMIGLLIIQALKVAGCGRIIAVDLDPGRLELACQLGADEGLNPDAVDVVTSVLARTAGRGARPNASKKAARWHWWATCRPRPSFCFSWW